MKGHRLLGNGKTVNAALLGIVAEALSKLTMPFFNEKQSQRQATISHCVKFLIRQGVHIYAWDVGPETPTFFVSPHPFLDALDSNVIWNQQIEGVETICRVALFKGCWLRWEESHPVINGRLANG